MSWWNSKKGLLSSQWLGVPELEGMEFMKCDEEPTLFLRPMRLSRKKCCLLHPVLFSARSFVNQLGTKGGQRACKEAGGDLGPVFL